MLSDDHDDVIAMRIAPRTMLMSTMLYVGTDVDAVERYGEFCDLIARTNDVRSLAIAMAGRVMSLNANDVRVREAAALASELEELVSGIDCDAATRAISSQLDRVRAVHGLRVRRRVEGHRCHIGIA